MTEIQESHEDNVQANLSSIHVGWLSFSTIVTVGMCFLIPNIIRDKGHDLSVFKMIIGAIITIPLSYYGALIGNFLRKIAMPDAFFSSGMGDTLKKKFFWAVGPQLIGLFATQWIVWALLFSKELQ